MKFGSPPSAVPVATNRCRRRNREIGRRCRRPSASVRARCEREPDRARSRWSRPRYRGRRRNGPRAHDRPVLRGRHEHVAGALRFAGRRIRPSERLASTSAPFGPPITRCSLRRARCSSAGRRSCVPELGRWCAISRPAVRVATTTERVGREREVERAGDGKGPERAYVCVRFQRSIPVADASAATFPPGAIAPVL